MTQSKTDLQVTTLEAAEAALDYARMAMLPAFSVTYTPKIPFPVNRDDLSRTLEYTLAPYNAMLRLQERMNDIFGKEAGDFAAAQQRAFSGSSSMYTFVRKARLDAAVQFHTSPKEANDLICLAAGVGADLKAKLGNRPTLERIFHVYQAWINASFRYLSTGQPEDHSAYALVRKGSGVCQAIAALTVLVLPHLGLETQYVSGQGLGSDGFGGHAWNAVRVPAGNAAVEDQLQWYHVDFTFGMNGLTPHTLTPGSAAVFEKTHLWDRDAINQTSLQRRFHRNQQLCRAQLYLSANRPTWQLGEISITSPRPVLLGNEQQGHWLDLYTLLRFLGGGCEYLPNQNQLRIVLPGRQCLVENGRAYLGGPGGYLNVSVLRHLPLQVYGTAEALFLKAVSV